MGIPYRLVYSASLISGREREISINNCSNSSELANLILILSKWIYTPVSIKSPSESYVLIENEYSLGINVIVGISYTISLARSTTFFNFFRWPTRSSRAS